MTEETYLKYLTIAIAVITGLLSIVMAGLTYFLKNLHEDIKATKKEMAEVRSNYLSRFTGCEIKITDFERRVMEYFEELRGVLNDHFQERHAEVVLQIAELQNQINEHVRRNNDASTKFYREYSSVLDWAKIQMDKHNRRGDVHEDSHAH